MLSLLTVVVFVIFFVHIGTDVLCIADDVGCFRFSSFSAFFSGFLYVIVFGFVCFVFCCLCCSCLLYLLVSGFLFLWNLFLVVFCYCFVFDFCFWVVLCFQCFLVLFLFVGVLGVFRLFLSLVFLNLCVFLLLLLLLFFFIF